MTMPGTHHVANGDHVRFNAEQLHFINNVSGPGVLHASMGTGKTLVLAERAAEAIRQGVDPGRILCVTFTNRAAEQMRSRIARRCGPDGRRVRVATFHALCAWMLRVEAKRVGIPRDFTIFDEEDAHELLRTLARDETGRPRVAFDRIKEFSYFIANRKTNAPVGALNAGFSHEAVFSGISDGARALALAYQHTLREYHAVDFSDLVFLVRCLLFCDEDAQQRWKHRFDMVQVDEVQDTHVAEYEVVSLLASGSGNLVLAGDFDQTIYGWRGSEPSRVLSLFREQFPGARQYGFSTNYRSTRRLLNVAASVAATFSEHRPAHACDSASEGERVVAHFAANEFDEARWIESRLRALREDGIAYGHMAVLVRTNQRAQVISQELVRNEIPHLTVEAYEFFRRQEIKDALAYLRFLANPWDGHSLRRIVARPARGIGSAALDRVAAGADAGLRLTDFTNEFTLAAGDPLGPLMDAWDEGDIVVFDTETTGLDAAYDEIVEIAGIKLRDGVRVATFHQYIQNTVPVGESEAIHGLSDEYLQREGISARRVMTEFKQFVGDSILVGHNVEFDMRMLRANMDRLNIAWPDNNPYFDTLDMARRFIESEDYRLETLAQKFAFAHLPQHHALDDVEATCELLGLLMPYTHRTAVKRRAIVAELADAFKGLAAEITVLRRKMAERPPALLDAVLRDTGLYSYYVKDARRKANLLELRRIVHKADRLELGPRASLDAFLSVTSLSRNVDRLDDDEGRVKVLTVHQAKGLEFDAVFVAGLCENEFPGYLALKDGNEAEERRVFYVAVTRAKKRLFLSGHGKARGRDREPSRYFDAIGNEWTEEGSTVLSRGDHT